MISKTLRRMILATLLLVASSPGFSETIAVGPEMTVRTDGVCSFPEAVDNANRDERFWADCPAGDGPDRLELTPGHDYIATVPWPGSQSALPPIRDDLEIIGFAASLRRDAVEPFRLIEVSNASLLLTGMVLEDGLSDSPNGGPAMDGGGAIRVDQASLTIQGTILRANRSAGLFTLGGALRMDDSDVTILDSLLEGNSATSTAANAGGGAIAQFNGTLTIRRSALIDNFTDIPCNPSAPSNFASNGGALRIEASAATGAQAYIYDSTIADNRAVSGGGIHLAAIADTGVAGIEDVFVQLMRSTVVGNEIGCPLTVGEGDGIRVQTLGGGEGLVAFGNTILHGNGRDVAGTIDGVDCSANSPNVSFVSLEGNVLDDADACPGGGFDAFVAEVDQVIDTQRNFTHYLPLANGPAVDFLETGVNCPSGTEDQLGNPRAGGAGQGGALCDAGAIELQDLEARFTLFVSRTGVGSGTVVSQPAGIDCPGECTADFDNGTLVDLFATPAQGDTFFGWTGACTGVGVCTLTMDQARSVTANFAPSGEFPLTVAVLGGSARVTSQPGGIDCPDTCEADFSSGTSVELTQVPEPGFEFVGWGGACAGTGDCTVVMGEARTVVANYTDVETRVLSVAVVGAGSVTSLPERIDCLPLCTAEFNLSDTVELVADPGAGSSFIGWSGDCSGTGICQLPMSSDRSVTATFSAPAETFPLQVSIDEGSGTVVSSPSGIDCPGTCSADFPENEVVELIPQVDPGFVFDGWSGDCAGDGSCFVTMDEARSVSAFFLGENTLTVSVTGAGSVVSTPAGIDCPVGACSATFVSAEKVLLQPQPEPGETFLGWGGACAGTGTCVVSMEQDRQVSAMFSTPPSLNTLEVAIVGSGSVTSDPPTINCPPACSSDFLPGVEIELIASPEPGFTFDRWTGDCSGSGACTVTMNGDRSVTAVFEPTGFELRVVLEGEGTGQVVEIPGPGTIDCPGVCSAFYPAGTEVSLGASIGPDSRFIGYRGDCQGGSCTVTMDRDREVRAVFLSDEQVFIDSFEQ